MSQHSARQAAQRSATRAQAVRRRAVRERRLAGLAVEVGTALGERAAATRDGGARRIPRGTARTLTSRAHQPARLLPRRTGPATQQ